MNRLIRRVADLPVMIVVTFRPEFTPPWLDLGHVTVLKLNLLGRSQVVDLIHNAAGGKTLPEAIAEQIAAKSQGVPLYIEEITRSILESGDLEDFGDRYVFATINSRIHHSVYVAGLSDRASGSPRLGQGRCARGIDHRQRVFLRADRGDIAGASRRRCWRTLSGWFNPICWDNAARCHNRATSSSMRSFATRPINRS